MHKQQNIAFLIFFLSCMLATDLRAQPTNFEAGLAETETLFAAAKYADALAKGQAMLSLARDKHGKKSRQTALALEKLGDLYLRLGLYRDAEDWTVQALEHRQTHKGKAAWQTGALLCQLGMIYGESGRRGIAYKYYEHSVAVLEKAADAPALAITLPLNQMAAHRYLSGDPEAAKILYQRVMQIQEKALGLMSVELARTLNNIGGVYLQLGDIQKARAVYSHALNMQEQVLGKGHPETATTLVNLGVMHDQAGEHSEAENRLREALKVREARLNITDPLIGQTIDNLVTFYLAIGQNEKAVACLRDLQATRLKAFGPGHPAVAEVLDKFAGLHLATGEYGKSTSYLEAAQEIRENHFEPHDDHIAVGLYNLGKMYNRAGRYEQARITLNRALDIYGGQRLGSEAAVMAILSELVVADLQQGMTLQAELHLELMLKVRQETYGPEHPETVAVWEELHTFYLQNNRPEDAEDAAAQIEAIRNAGK